MRASIKTPKHTPGARTHLSTQPIIVSSPSPAQHLLPSTNSSPATTTITLEQLQPPPAASRTRSTHLACATIVCPPCSSAALYLLCAYGRPGIVSCRRGCFETTSRVFYASRWPWKRVLFSCIYSYATRFWLTLSPQ